MATTEKPAIKLTKHMTVSFAHGRIIIGTRNEQCRRQLETMAEKGWLKLSSDEGPYAPRRLTIYVIPEDTQIALEYTGHVVLQAL